MTFAIGIAILLGLMVLAVPIGFALGLAGFLSLNMIVPLSMIQTLMSKVVHETTSNMILLTIPMFVLMAEFLACGGVAKDLLLACHRMMRGIKGGLAMACIAAGAVHAAATGSSTASAASLARASFPAMRAAGYAPLLSVGTIAIAGTLAIMIPPSVAFVLFGIITETSIGRLFMGGIIPGLMTAAGYMVTIAIVLWFKPELGPSRDRETQDAKIEKGGSVWPMALLIAIVLGGLYSGVATPTEISAIGALGALLISLGTGRMTRKNFIHAVGGTLKITTMIMTIIFCAHIVGYFITFSRITDTLLEWIAVSGMSPTAVMLVVVGIYLVLGMFMDQAAILILTAPISTALMVGLGFDPVWWGIIIIKTAEVGLVSPPLGLVTFIVASTTRTELPASFRGVMPFLVAEFVTLGLLLAFPQLTLWLT
ncbi:TRAP transporter large permease [Antarctobacter sp.]|uniref:TRAP transporter large permease n=1 Tax=Antarctobacter sp. TaxID=1872577 RepID=UPI003A90D7B2